MAKCSGSYADMGAVGEPFRDPSRPAGPPSPLQLVMAVGRGRGGALAVMQRGIVPEPVTDPIPLHGTAIANVMSVQIRPNAP